MDQLIGQTLGRYQIISLLGEGGMGAVYKARDNALQREVALKVMHAQFARQQNFQDRFLQEARVEAQLDHPGIVKVYDFGSKNGLLYIVMEFIPGANLAQMLRTLRADKRWIILPEAVQLISQIALALDYAHRQGVLHRDIKPSNIMLKPAAADSLPYQPVITDLGLAKLNDSDGLTQSGSSMGTPAYMSPEQALGEEMDIRSDVYSLGVLFYELAVGQLPFPADTLSKAIHYHTSEPAPAPKSLRPDLPPRVEQIILRALEKKPGDRFASAAALAQALTLIPPETIVATVPPLAAAGASSMLTQYQQSLLEPRGSSILRDFPSIGPGPARLQVLSPDGKARAISLDKRVFAVGRDADNDLVLNDAKVSRHHLHIEFDGTEYRVTDLNSANGLYLGQIKLLSGVPEPWPADKPLRVGNHHLRLIPLQQNTEQNPVTYASQGGADAGQIGVYSEVQALVVKPGERATLPVVLINQGAQVEHLQLALKGVPSQWVQMPSPVQLLPGGQQDATLTIQPPRSSQTRAGAYTLTLHVKGSSSPGLEAVRQVALHVEPFTGFHSELSPGENQAGQPFKVTVQNQGNAPQVYQLSWQDQANALAFEPPQAQLPVQPGEKGAVAFSARLQRRRWIGGAKAHPIAVRVTDRTSEGQQLNGAVVSRGLIPVWAPPLLLLLLIGSIAWAASVIGKRNEQIAAGIATATVVQQVALATKTAQAQANLNAAQAATATALWLDGDDDRDGLTNRQELDLKTLPNKRDTDEDGLDDGEEVNKWHTNPLVADTDGDGLKDGEEIKRGIDPLKADTDGDGTPDASDTDPGHVPTPTPNSAATAAVIATQTAVAQAALAATAQAQTAQQAAAATSAAQATLAQQGAVDATATAQTVLAQQAADGTATAQQAAADAAAAAQAAQAAAASATAQAVQQAAANETATAQTIFAQQTADAATAQAIAQQAADQTATAVSATQTAEAAPTPTPQVIHFADFGADANRESSQLAPDGHNAVAGTINALPWNGSEGDDRGFIILSNSVMEDNNPHAALRMHPKWVENGTVKMWFRNVRFQATPHAQFVAQVGFLRGAGSPDGVTFWVWEHHSQNGRETWNPIVQLFKKPTGSLQLVQADLSALAGQDVYLELRIDAGASSGQDWAAWVDPQVILYP